MQHPLYLSHLIGLLHTLHTLHILYPLHVPLPARCKPGTNDDGLPYKEDAFGCLPLNGCVRQRLIALIEWYW